MEPVIKHSQNPVLVVDILGRHFKFLYEFTMYRTLITYDVPAIRFRGELRGGQVELDVCGLKVRRVWYDENGIQQGVDVDLGLVSTLSTQQYEVNFLQNKLCRIKVPTIDLRRKKRHSLAPDDFIISVIDEETASWRNNDWASPFGKVAERLLKEKLRKEPRHDPRSLGAARIRQNRSTDFKSFGLFSSAKPSNGGLTI